MTDAEKIKLIGTMIADFWDAVDVTEFEGGMNALVQCITTVVDFDGGANANGKTIGLPHLVH